MPRFAVCLLLLLLAAHGHSTSASAETTCLRYSGLDVLYHTGVGQASSSSRSTLRDQLTMLGANFVETSDLLTPALLQTTHVLWLTDQTVVFSGLEFTSVRDWLQAGGRVLFEGDGTTSISQWKAVIDQAFTSDSGFPLLGSTPAGATSNIYTHPTTAGVSSIELPGPGGVYAMHGNSPTRLFDDVPGNNVVSVAYEDNGRFVFVGDDVFEDAAIGLADNLLFGKNIFDWLGEYVPLGDAIVSTSAAAIDVQLEAGQQSTVDLDINNLGTCTLDITQYALHDAFVFPNPPVFSDDFEDGDFLGWIDAGGSGTKQVTSSTAAGGTNFSYHESSSGFGHYDGVYATLGPIQPGHVSYWVRAGQTDLSDGSLVLKDQNGTDLIAVQMGSSGNVLANLGAPGGGVMLPYQAGAWHNIALSNIDFNTQTFDLAVDGATGGTGISFLNGGGAGNFDEIHLYNFHPGTQAYWDEIDVYDQSTVEWVAGVLTPTSIPAFGGITVQLSLDATLLSPGVYNGSLDIASNDPINPLVTIPITLTVDSPVGIGDRAPHKTALGQNRPNPFNPTTRIPYELEQASHVRISVFDVSGRMVKRIVDGAQPAGVHGAVWHGRDRFGQPVSSGVYFYRLEVVDVATTRKMLLLK